MASIELDRVSKLYGNGNYGVHEVDLTIPDGEFVIFLGPSGCGKSTTLRMIAGLESISSGDLRIGGKSVANVAPRDRNVAVVFQSYALYPHMSVRQNMAFGLKMRGTDAAVIDAKIADAANLLGLQNLLGRKPAALSGGQRQRVALGRAIVREPAAFLLDEPLSNLDAQLRAEMRLELVKLHRRLGRTIVHVTHDQVEAMTMGDRICIMRDGRLVQAGRPLEVYADPVNTFVARFLATPPMNLIPATLQAAPGEGLSVLTDSGAVLAVPARHRNAYGERVGRRVILGVRAEDFHESPDKPDWQKIAVRVVAVEALGAENVLIGQIAGQPTGKDDARPTGDDKPLEIAARLSRYFTAPVGSIVELYIDPLPMHLFDPKTELVIARPSLMGAAR
ncbi:ABC transporter ATP-binding protein [Mesorhizobium sp. CO1-1-8]|uniref:ABC transporter ATP-binding protein n=2 Tax=unclassified Mesorhizobium TaxID=325217 RepID=UPI001CD0A5BD|nr:ATP-binding cassette domain-containing protein [Mesorhizobium sp. CO1-1-8]MBZ9775521.1 ATP-binding cassette domain-containing protein [Mesorhizobium sp. CO1-1-8]